mmetsp:Transcript_78000/g.252196  ORF Transcript_78000/g.252196 Transcript_78000/m.252196 type:complete len:229 (+) Transcript_78000:318-1004(+)
MAGAALALLFGGVGFLVHTLDGMQEQLDVSLGFVHGSAKKLQAAHVRGALDLHATLAALLEDRLFLLHGVHRGLLVLFRLTLTLLLLLLVLRLLDVLLVQLHLLQGVGLRLHGRDARDFLHCLQEGGFGLEGLGLPLLEGLLRHLGHDLEVLATAADHALHAGHALDGADIGQDLLQLSLRQHQRSIVGIRGPLEAPLTGNVLELHERHGFCKTWTTTRTAETCAKMA